MKKLDIYNKSAVDVAVSKYGDYLASFGHTEDQIEAIIASPITAGRNPTSSEIRFGADAWHTKEFDREVWLKPDGTLKTWTVCPHDGLRYYRSRY